SSNRTGLEVAIGNRCPCDAGIHRFPDATAGCAHVVSETILREARDRSDAAASFWPDRAPSKRVLEFLDFLRASGVPSCENKQSNYERKHEASYDHWSPP